MNTTTNTEVAKTVNHCYVKETNLVSKEEIALFKNKSLLYNEEISQVLSEPQNGRYVIEDGVFDYEGYLNSKIKILWIMKEPYETIGGKGGGWHFSKSGIYTDGEFGKSKPTWYPIVYTSHGILNQFLTWEQMGRIRKNDKKLTSVLSHIGYINVQKLPSLTREKTDNTVIFDSFKKNERLFKRQFELLNPDVIIGASTLWMMFEHFGLKGNLFRKTATNTSYLVGGKLFINAKHPAQRSYKRGQYINDIIEVVKEWQERK